MDLPVKCLFALLCMLDRFVVPVQSLLGDIQDMSRCIAGRDGLLRNRDGCGRW